MEIPNKKFPTRRHHRVLLREPTAGALCLLAAAGTPLAARSAPNSVAPPSKRQPTRLA
jgi:hypothetical protein